MNTIRLQAQLNRLKSELLELSADADDGKIDSKKLRKLEMECDKLLSQIPGITKDAMRWMTWNQIFNSQGRN